MKRNIRRGKFEPVSAYQDVSSNVLGIFLLAISWETNTNEFFWGHLSSTTLIDISVNRTSSMYETSILLNQKKTKNQNKMFIFWHTLFFMMTLFTFWRSGWVYPSLPLVHQLYYNIYNMTTIHKVRIPILKVETVLHNKTDIHTIAIILSPPELSFRTQSLSFCYCFTVV